MVNFENEFFSFDGREHEITFGDPGLRTTAEFKQRFGNGNDVAVLFKKYWFIKDMTYVPISKKEEDGAQLPKGEYRVPSNKNDRELMKSAFERYKSWLSDPGNLDKIHFNPGKGPDGSPILGGQLDFVEKYLTELKKENQEERLHQAIGTEEFGGYDENDPNSDCALLITLISILGKDNPNVRGLLPQLRGCPEVISFRALARNIHRPPGPVPPAPAPPAPAPAA
ncbi:MAG: hypothetical protein EBU84_18870, partial [Actinobacteria bacterium]|nr:hypothetical protein [Actinomycetota bacterium]